MAALKLGFFFLFVLLHILLLLSHSVSCDKDKLLEGINKYRKSHNLEALKEHRRASCVAKKIAHELSDRKAPCTATIATTTQERSKLVKPKYLKICKLPSKTIRESVIMPVCVPKLDSTLLLRNYTQNRQFDSYLNNVKYKGAGLGHENDWVVVVLTEKKPAGSLFGSGAPAAPSSSSSLVSLVCLVLLMGLRLF